MIKPTPFTPIQAEHLRRFLAAPERPAGTFSYLDLAGFLFAICCSPEMVPPSAWLPLVFDDQDAGYRDMEEAQQTVRQKKLITSSSTSRISPSRSSKPKTTTTR